MVRSSYGRGARYLWAPTSRSKQTNDGVKLAGEAYQAALAPDSPVIDRNLVVISIGRTHYVVYDPNGPNTEHSLSV